MLRQPTLVIFLLLLAAMSWWSLSQVTPGTNKPSTTSKEGPDFFMEQFVSVEMSENGSPMRQLKAQRLTHYPNDDRSELVQPVITFFKDQKNVWLAGAQRGTVLQGGDELTMSGNVKIIKPLTAQISPEPAPEHWASQPAAVTIDTQDLHIYVKKNYAQTESAVVIKQDHNKLTSVGMQADFEAGNIELLSQIRGRYEY